MQHGIPLNGSLDYHNAPLPEFANPNVHMLEPVNSGDNSVEFQSLKSIRKSGTPSKSTTARTNGINKYKAKLD
jgi:hypothetical protein